MRFILAIAFLFVVSNVHAQQLKLKHRKFDAIGGREFANSISDTSLTLAQREAIIYSEIKSGNVPNFLRKLTKVDLLFEDKETKTLTLSFYVLPDYLAIGSDNDFFYMPMTPILAQRIATLTKTSLPTRQLVDSIYKKATIKLEPKPIPPTKAMTTVPQFLLHNELVNEQLISFLTAHRNSELTAGNKKDIIISNKIYTEKTPKVVIYGWHMLDGKPIQPVYNKHTNLWADYSHGVRLLQQKIWINGQKNTIKKALANPKLHALLSDEGLISKPYYPITEY